MSAWITREWIDPSGKRRRAQAVPGLKGIAADDQFVVEWLDGAGKRSREKIKERGKVGKRLADDRAKQLNGQLTLGTYQPKARSSWSEVRKRFEADILPTKRSTETAAGIKETLALFEKLVRPNRMEEITTALVDRFVAERLKQKNRRGEPVRASTINKDLRHLKMFFRRLAKWKVLRELPEIVMLDEIEQPKPVYTEAEFVAMHEQADAAALPLSQHLPAGCSRGLWWRTLLVLLWETGCRRGELLSLRWSEVDLDSRSLAVNPANVKSKRLKVSSFGDLGEQHLRRLAQFGADASGLVFAWRHDPTRLNEQLGLIQAAAGIDSTRAGLKFHAFRRTVGDTIAELHGLTAAQQKLGHSTASITAKHYAAAAMRRLAKKTTMPVPDSLRAASEAVIEAPVRRGHSEASAESS